MSTLLSACAPPFKMFIIGVGMSPPARPPIYFQSGSSCVDAPACRHESEAPSIALAPKWERFGVPSISIKIESISDCSSTGIPTKFSCIVSTTLLTAFSTPFPSHLFSSPSLVQWLVAPVDAPLGTITLPAGMPSTAICFNGGKARLSNTSLASTPVIMPSIHSPIGAKRMFISILAQKLGFFLLT